MQQCPRRRTRWLDQRFWGEADRVLRAALGPRSGTRWATATAFLAQPVSDPAPSTYPPDGRSVPFERPIASPSSLEDGMAVKQSGFERQGRATNDATVPSRRS